MGSSNFTGTQTRLIMGKGQNEGEGGFSEDQIQMYKDCFKIMDINKDGQIDKNDLRGAFDNVGVLMPEGELDSLLGEISGPCTPDNMIAMFQEKMAGEGNDGDDVIVQAFKAYEADAKIDSKMFTHALTTWGDKMSLGSLWQSRRRRRRKRPLLQLRKPLLQKTLRRERLRRRRRRRRRPLSK